MAIISRIIEADGVQLYVKVTIIGKKVEMVWDKYIPPSKVRQSTVMNHL